MSLSIKWRNQDIKKLQTYVRKFNAAITRLEKSNPSLQGTGAFPERLNVKELREDITTRSQFNKQLRKIDRFFKPGARDIIQSRIGLPTTKWQERENKYLERSINARKKALIKKYNIPKSQHKFLGLEPVDIAAKQQEILSKNEHLPDIEDKINNTQSFFNFLYEIAREAQADYYEQNFFKVRNSYLKAIEEHLAPDQAIELITLLQENDIWGTDILWAISQNDILDFEYFYSLDEIREKGNSILEVWNELIPKLKADKKRMAEHADYCT